MKLLLIDNQDRLVLTGHVDIKDFHIKGNNEYDEFGGLTTKLTIPMGRTAYSMTLKANFVEKDGKALSVYPDRVEDEDVEIHVCSTINGAACIHEHRRDCYLYGATRNEVSNYGITIDCGC